LNEMETDMSVKYETKFGSLKSYEKGRVEPIADDVKHYVFSNCFEIANKSKPYEKVVFGKNQIYVLEVLRAEGSSPWFTCAHDEFALNMDGDVEIHLIKLDGSQTVKDEEKNGAVLVQGEPKGQKNRLDETQTRSSRHAAQKHSLSISFCTTQCGGLADMPR